MLESAVPKLCATAVPSYRLHKQSGQAIVTLSGRDHLLGPHGTLASYAAYRRAIVEWEAAGRTTSATADLRIVELIHRFWKHAKDYYSSSREAVNIRLALRPLLQMYCDETAASFGPLALQALREAMIKPHEHKDRKTGQTVIVPGWSRNYANAQVRRIRQLFRWAVKQQLIPPSVHQGLQAVDGLKRGRSAARETEPVKPVAPAHVEAVLPLLPPAIKAIVLLQRYTGARPGEILAMKTGEIDTSASTWVYVRLDHALAAPSPAQQILQAMAKAAAAAGVEAPAAQSGDTLWAYFHRAEARLWTPQNRVATPVLVLDQFEELFTSGHKNNALSGRGRLFVQDLADLVENRIPDGIRLRLDSHEVDVDAFDFDAPPCKVVIALREDYLPELQSLKPILRSMLTNCMRMVPMNGRQALDVVRSPAGTLVDEAVALRIVQFVAAGSTSDPQGEALAPSSDRSSVEVGNRQTDLDDSLTNLEVEPALLSVVCFELNKKRQAVGLPRITADLLEGNSREILRDFYERGIADLPASVREFVEDELVTRAGHRNRVAMDNALDVPGVTPDVLEQLVARRLIRVDLSNRGSWLELTHDRLTERHAFRIGRDAAAKELPLWHSRTTELLC
jgi:integrase